jgi:dATP pyrophosphohydrolase
MFHLVDVYPYRLTNGLHQFLLLKRSAGKEYSGQWRMVGGKIQQGETAWQCALRELREETGASPKTFWSVPSLNHFYDHKNDEIELIPAFAAELSRNHTIKLDAEHSSYQWIDYENIGNYVHWPEQMRLISVIHSILKSREPLDDWMISL